MGAGVGIAFYNRSPFPIPHSLFPLIHQVFTLIARKASSSDSQTWRMARASEPWRKASKTFWLASSRLNLSIKKSFGKSFLNARPFRVQ